MVVIVVPLGCNFDPPVPPLAPVKGKVTVGDKPLTSGQVSLQASDKDKAPKFLSAGKIESDGSYEIFTAGKSGAPKGIKFKFLVTPAMTLDAASGGFDKKYSNRDTTPLEFEVVDDPAAGRYDLKLK
jgi:hypothetical protein